MKCHLLCAVALMFILINPAPSANPKSSKPTGIVFENVHFFNGISSQLSAPSHVLVAGNVIKSVSGNPIADLPDMVMRGFTSIRDMGGSVFGLIWGFDMGLVQKARIWSAGGMISKTGGYSDVRLINELPAAPGSFSLILPRTNRQSANRENSNSEVNNEIQK
jgi:hypothetical protein